MLEPSNAEYVLLGFGRQPQVAHELEKRVKAKKLASEKIDVTQGLITKYKYRRVNSLLTEGGPFKHTKIIQTETLKSF